jgi:aspartate kinase
VSLPKIAILKIGGSVLTDAAAYERTAEFIAQRLSDEPDTKLVAVVSAEHGVTDALLELARGVCGAPDPGMVDLLWSTGELRSVALLALALQARAVRATGINVHQTGLTVPDGDGAPGYAQFRPLRIFAALAAHAVVVAPGFLARGAGDSVTSLGRGGSDLTAVLLAAGLGATRCELIKDVSGYFSADPHRHADAHHVPFLSYAAAVAMADDGCELVQRAALTAAEQHEVPVVVRSIAGRRLTHITNQPVRS